MAYSKAKRTILTVSIVTLIINLIIMAMKILGGVFGNSKAMMSDATHSIFDTVSTLLVIFSVLLMKISSSKGLKRRNDIVQGIFTLILAVILLYTCVELLIENFHHIFSKAYLNDVKPKNFEIWIAVFCILSKEIVYRVNMAYAVNLNYPPLSANAWHQRLNSMTSFATLFSLLLVRLFDLKIADSIFAILISLFLLFIIFEDVLTSIEKISGKHILKHRKTVKKVRFYLDDKDHFSKISSSEIPTDLPSKNQVVNELVHDVIKDEKTGCSSDNLSDEDDKDEEDDAFSPDEIGEVDKDDAFTPDEIDE